MAIARWPLTFDKNCSSSVLRSAPNHILGRLLPANAFRLDSYLGPAYLRRAAL
jgi:hypothetical protein